MLFKIVDKTITLYISKSGFYLSIFNKSIDDIKNFSITNKFIDIFSDSNSLVIKYGNIDIFPRFNEIENVGKTIKNTFISKNHLKKFIENSKRNLLIYTGAGMSRRCGIPTMKELKKALFINDIDLLLNNALHYPKKIIKKFRIFEIKLRFAKPSDFHFTLKKFILKNNIILVTENLDFMHEKSGIKPFHSYVDFDLLMNILPKNVLLIGIGETMMNKIFQKWHINGTNFVAINNEEVLINVPCKVFIGNIEKIDRFFE